MEGLKALTPLDGRYANITKPLADIFSEYSLIKNRVMIEVEYLIFLSEFGRGRIIRELTSEEKNLLRKIYRNFPLEDAQKIKAIEQKTKHDINAVILYLKDRIEGSNLRDISHFVHFGLTSDDVNNIAYSLMLKEALESVLIPVLKEMMYLLVELSIKYKDLPLLARTHGQPASPTTLGKEFSVFAERLGNEIKKLLKKKLPGKISGATGNFNAFYASFPEINWLDFSKKFIENFGLEPKIVTTQVVPHEDISDILQNLIRINNIIIELNVDMWLYISYGYFYQKSSIDEVGSSTMPHKVNPINFENSEGNLKVANSMLSMLANELQISRLQRDLSGSTIRRNYGTAMGYCLVAYKNTIKGLKKLTPNVEKMRMDLDQNAQVVMEAFQVILKKYGYRDAYERLMKLSKGRTFTIEEVYEIIKKLNLPEDLERELAKITPQTYTGIAEKLAVLTAKKWLDFLKRNL
ncbi:MAG: adenylosuccinate lyase [Thermoprotei archaeon]|nr:MAG: adenylosuccinate lyase [Thermoprotei archaeon]